MKILMIVTNQGNIDGEPTTGVWFSEFSEPFAAFVEAGVEVTVASPLGGPCPVDPRHYSDREEIAGVRDALERLNATRPLARIRPEDFDGVFMPGGHGPMFDLATDSTAKAVIASFWQASKPVGAVCLASLHQRIKARQNPSHIGPWAVAASRAGCHKPSFMTRCLSRRPIKQPYWSMTLEFSPELASGARIARSLFNLLRTRNAQAPSEWSEGADLSPLAAFARHWHRDKDSVLAAMRLPWSNGMVEGHVHRLKLLKRQMYGRAGFDLLRERVINGA